MLRRILRLHAGSVGGNYHGYQKTERSHPCQALTLPSLIFVPGTETGIFTFIIDRMMDCWRLTLKELIDALYVCKDHLKLDGTKCVDFIHFTLAP